MNTTTRGKAIVTVAGALIALSALFPPWEYTFSRPGASKAIEPAGHYFLFDPPSKKIPGNAFSGVSLDFGRLVLIWCVVALGAGIAYLWVSHVNSPAIAAPGGHPAIPAQPEAHPLARGRAWPR
jgi:hypothetical protein